jgi:hypothetical protein
MDKIIKTIMSNPKMALGAVAVAVAAISLFIWVMKGDDHDRSSKSCRALFVLFLVGAVYVNRAYMMTVMQGRPAARNYGTDEFVTNLRSYYEPRHSTAQYF